MALRTFRRRIRAALGMPYREGRRSATNDIAKGVSVVKRILGSSDEEFASRDFVLQALLDFGLAKNDWLLMRPWANAINRSMLGSMQIPPEFCDFLMDCCGLRIASAVEIGVLTGGSSYFAAAMLQRANPSCVYTLVDIADYRVGMTSLPRS